MSDITNQPKLTKTIRVGVDSWKELRAEIDRLTRELAEARQERNVEQEFRGKYKAERDSLRAALRQTIINMGGIAEPGVSDTFLVEGAPAEAKALKDQRDELLKSEAALREALNAVKERCNSAGEGAAYGAYEDIREHIPEDMRWCVERIDAALATPAPEVLERVKREAQAEAYREMRAQAEELMKEGGLRARLLRLFVDEVLDKIAEL